MSGSSIPRVAVIDDEAAICASMSRLLRLSGFQPVTYLSAEAFLADEARRDFDCILADIRLGGMSGLELLQHLEGNGGHPPLIFVTAFGDPNTEARARAAGCAAYFRKATPGAEIVAAIRQAIGRN